MSCQISFTLKFGLPILYIVTMSLCNRAPTKDGRIYVEGKIVGGQAVPLEGFHIPCKCSTTVLCVPEASFLVGVF